MDDIVPAGGGKKNGIDGYGQNGKIQYEIEVFQIDDSGSSQFISKRNMGNDKHKEKGCTVSQDCGRTEAVQTNFLLTLGGYQKDREQ